jgi:hypothetical protein
MCNTLSPVQKLVSRMYHSPSKVYDASELQFNCQA